MAYRVEDKKPRIKVIDEGVGQDWNTDHLDGKD